MTRSVAFHPRFGALVPPLTSVDGSAQVVAVKLERIVVAGASRLGIDILLRAANGGLVPLAFGEVDEPRIVFPEAYAAWAQDIAALLDRMQPWLDAHLTDQLPTLNFLSVEPALEAVARDEFGDVIVPGLATFDRLAAANDRYRAIAPLAAGRRVVDLTCASGYGTHVLAAAGAAVSLACDERNVAVVRGLGIVACDDGEPAEVAVCFGVDAAGVPAALERCRARLAAGGTVALGVRGAGAHAALQAAGLEGARIPRAAGDTHPPLDEWLAVAGPAAPAVAARAPEPEPARVSPEPLRVLFALRPSAAQTFGGDVVQVRQTAAALERRGHEAVVTTDAVFDPAGYDVVHFSNLTVPRDTLGQMESVRAFDGAVVMMPIFTDHADETAWALHLQVPMFAGPNDTAQLDAYLDHFAQRRLGVPIALYGREVGAHERIEMDRDYLAMQREICRQSDYFIANADAEMHRVYRWLDPTVPYAIARSAMDPGIYEPARAEAFRERYRLGDFVVLPGRFEPRKGQLMLLAALRGTGLRIVFIGRSYETAYGDLVRAYLGPGAVVFPHMSEVDLAGALAAARVVVMPSLDEVVSLTSLNAAACGASLVLTRQSYEHEYFRDDAEYCDPVSVASIRDAVLRAWSTHDERAERRRALSQRVRREYSWDRAAEATEAAYYRLRASNPRGVARRSRPA